MLAGQELQETLSADAELAVPLAQRVQLMLPLLLE